MKTMILTAAMMILMIANPSWANADTTSTGNPGAAAFDATVKVKLSEIIEFSVNNPSNEKVTLTIIGERNNKLFERKVNGEETLRIDCNMKDFGKGTYTCLVEKNGEAVVRKDVTIGK
jgi:hypothetical protein